MDEGIYIVPAELTKIASLCETLDEFAGSDIGLGPVELFDVNGETMGYIEFSGDALRYVYRPTRSE